MGSHVVRKRILKLSIFLQQANTRDPTAQLLNAVSTALTLTPSPKLKRPWYAEEDEGEATADTTLEEVNEAYGDEGDSSSDVPTPELCKQLNIDHTQIQSDQ